MKRLQIFSVPVKTDASGLAIVKLPALPPGRLELRFESRADSERPGEPEHFPLAWDPRNTFPAGGEATLWVFDETVKESSYQPETLEIHLSKETAWPGDEITALLVTHLRNRDVLLTVSDGLGAEHSVVHVDGNIKTIQLRFPKDGSAKLSMAAAMVSEGLVFQCRKDVSLDPDARRLHIEVSPTGRTSAEEALRLRLADPRGRPARGKISVVLLQGEDEPFRDPLPDLLKVKPAPFHRETSLTRHPLAGSPGGINGPVQPECARPEEWGAGGQRDTSCDQASAGPLREDFERLSALEPEAARLLFRKDRLPTDKNGEMTIALPPCPVESPCRLRVWAAGEGHTFGMLDKNLPQTPSRQ